MIQTRRAAFRLARRSQFLQWRGYVDMKPSDPMDSSRQPEQKPSNETIGRGASSGTGSLHAASAGGHEPTHHGHHPEPVNENLGRGFYVSIAALALSFALYKFSRSTSADPASATDPRQPILTRMMHYYDFYRERYAETNARRTKFLEQAAADRNLFQSSPWTHHVELKFPEVFNTGSPYNVPAGHSVDLSELKAHYQKQNLEKEAKTMANLEATAGGSEILAQRSEMETGKGERPMSVSSVLEYIGLKRPKE